ncbi:MAG TPA: NAD(P)H-dependent glycerol-3-phosphate dehydrogenase [Thermoplasmata archaeon]|nr:NAD(P)H-dependent glycerol-3-phosphate dehydrogenase [Thermoplasmata archaeon]
MKYTVLGAGAMGSTIASRLLANGNEVCLWLTEKDEWLLPKLSSDPKHPLSGADLRGACLFAPKEIDKATHGAEALVIACSSDGFLEVLEQAEEHGPTHRVPAVVATKGFVEDDGTVRTLSETILRPQNDRPIYDAFCLLGGPMIAGEIAAGKPAGGVAASRSPAALQAARGLVSPALSLSESDDVRGIELCGALKNVYAILVGVAETQGANLRSLAFARSLEEMAVIVARSGGKLETVLGPAGAGDLYVTSISGRNGEFGRRVGSGEDPQVALREMEAAGKTVEGVRASTLGKRYIVDENGVDAPLLESVAKLCEGRLTSSEALAALTK